MHRSLDHYVCDWRLTDGVLDRCKVVNIGTATQLAVVLSAQDVARLDQRAMHKSFEIRPFLSEYHFLGVAASLSG